MEKISSKYFNVFAGQFLYKIKEGHLKAPNHKFQITNKFQILIVKIPNNKEWCLQSVLVI